MSFPAQGRDGQGPREPPGGAPGGVYPPNGMPGAPGAFPRGPPGVQQGTSMPGSMRPAGFRPMPGMPRPAGPPSSPMRGQTGGFFPGAPPPGGMRPPASNPNQSGGFFGSPASPGSMPHPVPGPPASGGGPPAGFPPFRPPGNVPGPQAMTNQMMRPQAANRPSIPPPMIGGGPGVQSPSPQTAPGYGSHMQGQAPMQPPAQQHAQAHMQSPAHPFMQTPGQMPMQAPGQSPIRPPGQLPFQPQGQAAMQPPHMQQGPRMMAPPTQPGGMAGGFAPPVAGYQQTLDKFEALTLGPSAPGTNDGITDAVSLPRPAGANADIALKAAVSSESTNCHPNFIRPTVNAIPRNSAVLQRFHFPVGAVVCPMAESEGTPKVPLVKLDSSGIVRCRRCRTYINPFVLWTDGGRRWSCNVCNALNEVAMDYFCTTDNNGIRRDIDERPELNCGSVEYVAPPEYMVRGPMPTVFFFVIDVTTAAVRSGMVARVAKTIKSVLDNLPGDDRKKVGFITVDSTLHFYNLKSSLSQPQMMVVADVDDPFLPLPDDLLVNLKESREVIDTLLDSLPMTFANTEIAESAMASALQASFLVMQHIGGKLLMFTSSVPSRGPGKIKNRDNAGVYGTDRESTLRNPEDPFYKKLAAECSRCQITVDTFAFGSQYMDLASISSIPRYTGGQVYYYPGFYIHRDGHKLEADVTRNLTRTTGWEAVMRIRCSSGLRISSFNGSFFIRSSDLLALPTIDPDKAFGVQIAHEEQILEGSSAYLQCALLYTASCGERRIRVHTQKLTVTSELSEVHKSADGAAIAALMLKLGVDKSQTTRLDDCRRSIETKLVSSMREYRMMHSSHFRGINKFIYPDTLKHLPLWVLGILKSTALRGGPDVQPDERIAAGYEVIYSSVEYVCQMLYPSIYPLGQLKGGWPKKPTGKISLPNSIPSSHEYLESSGIYLIDAGRVLILWVGREVPVEVLTQVFGPEAKSKDVSQLPIEPPKDNSASNLLCTALATIREGRSTFPQCYVIPQGSQLEAHIAPYFTEDRLPASFSYMDFMFHVHRGIGAKQ